MAGHSIYVITNEKKEIVGVTLPHPPEGKAYAMMLPGPGQRMYHLANVPKDIVETKDAAAFHASITKHFHSAKNAVEIETHPRAEFFAKISQTLKRAKP